MNVLGSYQIIKSVCMLGMIQEICDIFALCDRLMFGNNLYVFLCSEKPVSEENVF